MEIETTGRTSILIFAMGIAAAFAQVAAKDVAWDVGNGNRKTTTELGLDGTDDTLIVRGNYMSAYLSAGEGEPWRGDLVVDGPTLYLCSPGLLSDGACLTLEFGTVDFGGLDAQPGLVLAASGEIRNTHMKTPLVTKTTMGILTVNAVLQTDCLEIEEGMVRLYPTRAGLMGGINYTTKDDLKGVYDSNPQYDDFIELGPMMAYENSLEPGSRWKDYTVATYSGYIWSPSNETITCSMYVHIHDWIYTKVNDKYVVSANARNVLARNTFDFKPGANAFYAKMASKTGEVGAIADEYFWKTNDFALAFDIQGRSSQSPSDYVRMIDPGDGSFFTTACCKPGVTRITKLKTGDDWAGPVQIGETRTFDEYESAGGLFDEDLRIAKKWTIDAKDILAGASVYCHGNIELGPGAVIEITSEELLKGQGECLVIAETEGEIIGAFPMRIPGRHVEVVKLDDHTLAVTPYRPGGCLLLIR